MARTMACAAKVLHSGGRSPRGNGGEAGDGRQRHDVRLLQFPDTRTREREGHESHQQRGNGEEGAQRDANRRELDEQVDDNEGHEADRKPIHT